MSNGTMADASECVIKAQRAFNDALRLCGRHHPLYKKRRHASLKRRALAELRARRKPWKVLRYGEWVKVYPKPCTWNPDVLTLVCKGRETAFSSEFIACTSIHQAVAMTCERAYSLETA